MNYDTKTTAEVNFTHREMEILRASRDHDRVTGGFKKIPDQMEYDDVIFLRDMLRSSIEWGDFSEDEFEIADTLHRDLDSLAIKFERDEL